MPARAPPLTAVMVLAIADVFRKWRRPDFVAITLLAFHCALRIGEAMACKSAHLMFNSAGSGVVALPLTKSGRRKGAQEQVTIDDAVVAFWVSSRAAAVPNGPLTTASVASWRRWFAKALRELGLEGWGFKPYSLRRGGATHDFLQHQDFRRTMHRGRWQDQRTARIYLEEGAALKAQLKLPMHVAQHLEKRVQSFIQAPFQ